MSKSVSDDAPFGANSPFFRIIREGLEGLADGEDYFDLLGEDVVFEYVISVPGYPRRVEGRQNIIDLYSGYGDYMELRSADNLRVHRDPETSVVVLEYEVHGKSVQSGRPYDNRFVSVVTVKERKVTHWRDYLDPVAVFDAAGWPQSHDLGRGDGFTALSSCSRFTPLTCWPRSTAAGQGWSPARAVARASGTPSISRLVIVAARAPRVPFDRSLSAMANTTP
jgi:ketosteroid isomerase-like protein